MPVWLEEGAISAKLVETLELFGSPSPSPALPRSAAWSITDHRRDSGRGASILLDGVPAPIDSSLGDAGTGSRLGVVLVVNDDPPDTRRALGVRYPKAG